MSYSAGQFLGIGFGLPTAGFSSAYTTFCRQGLLVLSIFSFLINLCLRNTIELPLYEISYFSIYISNSFSYYNFVKATRLVTPSRFFLFCCQNSHNFLKFLLSSITSTFRCFITPMMRGAKNDVNNYSTYPIVLPAMIYYCYIYGSSSKLIMLHVSYA